MAQSLAKNYIHIVFSTKNWENIIKKEDLAEVFSYIAGVVKGCECNSYAWEVQQITYIYCAR